MQRLKHSGSKAHVYTSISQNSILKQLVTTTTQEELYQRLSVRHNIHKQQEQNRRKYYKQKGTCHTTYKRFFFGPSCIFITTVFVVVWCRKETAAGGPGLPRIYVHKTFRDPKTKGKFKSVNSRDGRCAFLQYMLHRLLAIFVEICSVLSTHD